MGICMMVITHKADIINEEFQNTIVNIFTTNDIHNFLADVSITPFCIRGLNGFSFSIKDAAIDLSELSNIPGMLFPKGYANTGGITPALWTGFYLRELKIKLPSEFSTANKRIEITASTFIAVLAGMQLLQVEELATYLTEA